jgi:KaiC/GvpD/RAD55 family RecA-like ATPase
MITHHNPASKPTALKSMPERIQPAWDQIGLFKNPLTPGERALAEFLDRGLPSGWEIFVQPFLNGDRPDLVILNPEVGLMIFEVKDWQSGLYHFEEKWVADRNGKRRIREYFVSDVQGEYPIPNPVSQVERYRENLINFYLPRVGEEIDRNHRKLGAFRIGLYFHKMTTNQARELLPVNHLRCSVFGYDWLDQHHLDDVVPDWNRKSSLAMQPDWVEEIRFWLTPPYHSIEQGQKLSLTQEQKRHIEPSSHQHQRLRGVAGSGKTLVVAQRAANLAEAGKRVLVVTYNITLWHYIRDHVSRARKNFRWDLIEFTHFHGFCRNYLSENNIRWPSGENDDEEFFMNIVPQIVTDAVKAGKNINHRKYDAVLIDEGQDFDKFWYHMLCEFLTENDELLLVVDERQNVYRRDLSWIDVMEGTRFRGRWRELKESYRLPPPLIEKANLFAHRFLGGEGVMPVPAQMELFVPHLVWKNIQAGQIEQVKSGLLESFDFLTRKQKIHPQDIVILVPSHQEGWELVQMFKDRGVETNHVFEDDNRSHHHKKSFWMGDSRLKVCTIHSFKGWELLNVILLTPASVVPEDSSLDRVIYTAITRSRQNLLIFNRHARYADYGESWPRGWE